MANYTLDDVQFCGEKKRVVVRTRYKDDGTIKLCSVCRVLPVEEPCTYVIKQVFIGRSRKSEPKDILCEEGFCRYHRNENLRADRCKSHQEE